MLTSLVGQYRWWGIPCHDFSPGLIRQNVFSSCWYIEQEGCDWKDEPAVTEPTWFIGYELPHWTISRTWHDQVEEATNRGMGIATATQDALMLNLTRAAMGKCLRSANVWSRTKTILDGSPLFVDSMNGRVRVGGRNLSLTLSEGECRLAGCSLYGMPADLTSYSKCE